jgi:hypothetical protein
MNLASLSGHGYLLVGGIILIGAGLVFVSLIFNLRVARSVRDDLKHREKLLEYYRNTFSQLGVILIGIGISLFIFFFQQNYQDQRRREAELQQIIARMAARVARGVPAVASLGGFDAILDDGGPYIDPDHGGTNRAVSARGADLAAQVAKILLVERDVELQAFEIMNISRDLDTSSIVSELNPTLWFNIVSDESDVEYATRQMALDYKDLHEAIGGDAVEAAIANPEKEPRLKQEALDILYDADLLRQRSRRLLARACWFFSTGQSFVSLAPVTQMESNPKSHEEWLEGVAPFLTKFSSGNRNCFQLLQIQPGS